MQGRSEPQQWAGVKKNVEEIQKLLFRNSFHILSATNLFLIFHVLAVMVGRPGVVLDGGSSTVDVQSDLASQETVGKQRGKPWENPNGLGSPYF